jgi:hypothetical protein
MLMTCPTYSGWQTVLLILVSKSNKLGLAWHETKHNTCIKNEEDKHWSRLGKFGKFGAIGINSTDAQVVRSGTLSHRSCNSHTDADSKWYF